MFQKAYVFFRFLRHTSESDSPEDTAPQRPSNDAFLFHTLEPPATEVGRGPSCTHHCLQIFTPSSSLKPFSLFEVPAIRLYHPSPFLLSSCLLSSRPHLLLLPFISLWCLVCVSLYHDPWGPQQLLNTNLPVVVSQCLGLITSDDPAPYHRQHPRPCDYQEF